MCTDKLQHAVQTFAAIFSVFVFGGILKTSVVTPFMAICKSHKFAAMHIQSYVTTLILMKFAGQLVMAVLIKGCGENVISEQKIFSRCILKTAKKLMTLFGICTLPLHYHKMG